MNAIKLILSVSALILKVSVFPATKTISLKMVNAFIEHHSKMSTQLTMMMKTNYANNGQMMVPAWNVWVQHSIMQNQENARSRILFVSFSTKIWEFAKFVKEDTRKSRENALEAEDGNDWLFIFVKLLKLWHSSSSEIGFIEVFEIEKSISSN